MKVLYVALHNPHLLDLASGSDYHYLTAIRENGFETMVIGPFEGQPFWLERLLTRLYQRRGKRYVKHTLTTAWRASQATNRAVAGWKPDVVLTIYASPLVFYRRAVPCVFRTDTTYFGLEQSYPSYGPLATRLGMWQEKRAFRNCAVVITHSEWSRNLLANVYKVPADRIEIYPEASTLPAEVIPEVIDISSLKALQRPVRLLTVGRDYRRKGIDIAIDVVHKLNQAGIRSELTICGSQGSSDGVVRYVGTYKKSDPVQLEEYVSLYRQAHFLIHPALFEPSGIVPGEAAAFGTPTITNNTGGLGTTVRDGESGIVLPTGSPAEAYVDAITHLVNAPAEYYALCRGARQRFEMELNWGVSGKRLAAILSTVVQQHSPSFRENQ